MSILVGKIQATPLTGTSQGRLSVAGSIDVTGKTLIVFDADVELSVGTTASSDYFELAAGIPRALESLTSVYVDCACGYNLL